MIGVGTTIFLVRPEVFPSGTSYIVDTYSPVVAFSVRKISSTATNCLRVRRDSDNAEQDIGFSGNDLDTASLSSFVGANSAYVTKWYNQGTGGATYDASQASAGSQPRIVNAGTIETTVNGRPTVYYTGSNALTMANTITDVQETSLFFAHERNTSTYSPAFGRIGTNSGSYLLWFNDGVKYVGPLNMETDNTTSGECLHFLYRDSSDDYRGWTNNVAMSGNPVNSNHLHIFQNVGSSNGRNLTGNYIEVIYFQSDESANRTAIESDINTYYSIY